MIELQIPKPNLYEKFGNPHRLVEFRVFSFNTCGAGCKNCFYKKSNNNYFDFQSVSRLAKDLSGHGYALETLYLLPTDVFENEFNYQVFNDPHFIELAQQFSYIGLATALNRDFDQNFLDSFFDKFPKNKIEMHVNLKEDLLLSKTYLTKLRSDVGKIKDRYSSKILLNLALNLGSAITSVDMEIIQMLVDELSDDGILELNFTFLFNESISKEAKTRMLSESYPVLRHFSDLFERNEVAYNSRTLLRKPSFVFKDEKIFLTPIIPFDEYAFVDDASFRLESPDFDSFLKTYERLEGLNQPILKECADCQMLSLCQGKHFFSLAQMLNLKCLKIVN
jgi:hypothetical protein